MLNINEMSTRVLAGNNQNIYKILNTVHYMY